MSALSSPSPQPQDQSAAPWETRIRDAAAVPLPTRRMDEGLSALSAEVRHALRCPLTRARLIPLDDHRLMSEKPYREGVHPVYEVVSGIPHLLPVHGLARRAVAASA